ncbi:Imm49 family immunity protein [Streptomyces klenkii]|uniref:Imm49 family immunity protein n=1 Tax=Streptomyces klenkii TaxID=1420899 RepID=UPI003439E1C5
MTAPVLYGIETSEVDDGTMHPVEQLWTPGEDAVENGFIVHRGFHVTGLDVPTGDYLYPIAFLVFGHQKWADMVEAAAAYMDRVDGWRNLHLYPGDDQHAFEQALAARLTEHRESLGSDPAPRTLLSLGPLALTILVVQVHGWELDVRSGYLPHDTLGSSQPLRAAAEADENNLGGWIAE